MAVVQIQVGDTLYYSSPYSEGSRYVKVDSIGRKYIQAGGLKFDRQTWKQETKYLAGQLYLSKDDWFDEVNARKSENAAIKEAKAEIDKLIGKADLDKLQQVLAILKGESNA